MESGRPKAHMELFRGSGTVACGRGEPTRGRLAHRTRWADDMLGPMLAAAPALPAECRSMREPWPYRVLSSLLPWPHQPRRTAAHPLPTSFCVLESTKLSIGYGHFIAGICRTLQRMGNGLRSSPISRMLPGAYCFLKRRSREDIKLFFTDRSLARVTIVQVFNGPLSCVAWRTSLLKSKSS